MFPCFYSHTNTPTAFSPLTEYLDKGEKSFRSVLVRRESGPVRECVRGGHGFGVDGCLSVGLSRGRDLEREEFTPLCPLRV